MRQVYIDLQDGAGFRNVSDFVKYNTLTVSTRAFNDSYMYAQNTCEFELNYDAVLYPLLLANTNDILVTVTQSVAYNLITEDGYSIATEAWEDLIVDAGKVLFVGHAKPSKKRSYDGILENTEWAVSAVDKADTLNVKVGDIVYINHSVYNPANPEMSIVHKLATIAGWPSSAFDSSVTISTVIPAFAPNAEDDKVLNIIDVLLHEYGYALNIDEFGRIHPTQWLVGGTLVAQHTFDNTNIVQEVSISDSVKQYDGVKVVYYEMGTAEKVRLFTDSNCSFSTDGTFAGYSVLNNTFYPPEANTIDTTTGTNQVVYQEYTDKAISYKTNYAIVNNLDYNYAAFSSDFSALVATTNHYVDRKATGLSIIQETFLNKKCRLLYKNESGSTVKIYYNDVYGDVYYKSKERKVTSNSVANPININTYTMQFVFDTALASAYASSLMAQYVDGQNVYEFLSEEWVDEGIIVQIVLGDGTTQYGIVRERVWKESKEQYSYVVTACSPTTIALTAQGVSQTAAIDKSVITSTLTPASVTIPYSNGTADFNNASAKMNVFRDGLDVTKDWSYDINTTGCSAYLDVTNPNIVHITAIANPTATITMTASRTNWANIVNTITVSKGSDSTYVASINSKVDGVIATGGASYRGRYQAAHPSSFINEDWWLVYDTDDSPLVRGIYYSSNGTPVRITTSSAMSLQAKMVDALTDVAWAEANGYGTATNYGIDVFYQSLGAVTAFINTLFAKTIKVQTGGSIYGGDRFNSSGTEVDMTKNGFWLGANGQFKGNLQSLSGNNTIIGTNAGLSCTSGVGGNENTIIGYSAAPGVVGSPYQFNTIVGCEAGFSDTTGYGNAFFGDRAGYNTTTGNINTFIGYSSGVANTIGSINTYVGFQSGVGLASRNNCTCLGYNTTTSGDNQVQLGDSSTRTYAYGPVIDRASDRRDKADIRPTSFGLDFINKLKPVEYRFNYREDYITHAIDGTIVELPNDGSKTRKRFHQGMIAQDVKEIIDEMGVDFAGYIDFSVDGGVKDRLTLSYGEFITPMIRAIQELSAKVSELEKKIGEINA